MRGWILTKTLLAGLLTVLIATSLYGESTRKLVQDGNKAYRSGQYDQALAKYKAALMAGGDPRIVAYNLGNTHYALRESEAAQQAYTESMRPERPRDLSGSVYNLGNAYLQGGKISEAISAYIEALKLNPDDEDAKYNLELARRMLNQMQQSQSQQSSEQQEQDQQEKRDSQEEQQQQDQQQQDQQQQNAEKQESEQTPPPKELEQRQMTPEEAERLLNALLQDEQDALKQVKKVEVADRPKREKDW
jgi:Ca-activated chloride channel family protein